MHTNKNKVNIIKELYPKGCRVELDYMEDQKAPIEGTRGTVCAVDDIGTIHVAWDDGRMLGVVLGVDRCHRI